MLCCGFCSDCFFYFIKFHFMTHTSFACYGWIFVGFAITGMEAILDSKSVRPSGPNFGMENILDSKSVRPSGPNFGMENILDSKSVRPSGPNFGMENILDSKSV